MKRTIFYILAGAAVITGATSCEDTKVDWNEEKDTMLTNILDPYVNKTVIPTYHGMADHAIDMAAACNTMLDKFNAGTLTEADVKTAGEAWNRCRDYWEKSEAFLYGPAGVANIDPHIDSWPLDKTELQKQIDKINNGGKLTYESLGYGLLGFHSVEYMLFELSADGSQSMPHDTDYSKAELEYLCLVAEDLRDQCIYLYAWWAGTDGLDSKYTSILEAAELEPAYNYGSDMVNAGKAGSHYITAQAAVEELVQGMIDIADEVGNTKIGNPVTGGSEENRNYIESPYSLNSINDFIGNIISIRNCYMGNSEADDYIGVYGSGDVSLSDYIKEVDSELDAKVKAKIEESITAIKAIGEPFVTTASTQEAKDAVRIVGTELQDLLDKVYSSLAE